MVEKYGSDYIVAIFIIAFLFPFFILYILLSTNFNPAIGLSMFGIYALLIIFAIYLFVSLWKENVPKKENKRK